MSLSTTQKPGVKAYMSMIKFSHTLFALPFAFIGFTLATVATPNEFSWRLLVLMLLCMVFARSAAMAFNRYLDRRFDALNPRTASREVAAGVIAPKKALWFTVICAGLFVVCAGLINPLCLFLSPVALFVILFYSYTKRFTALCHLVLGLGLSLSPLGAYLAVAGEFSLAPILFSFLIFSWVAGFDIIYALQDEEFDRISNLHSIPEALGPKNALIVSALLHVITIITVALIGVLCNFNWIYWLGAGIFSLLLIYQHIIVKPHDLQRVNIAFVHTNSVGSIIYAVLVISSLLTSSNLTL